MGTEGVQVRIGDRTLGDGNPAYLVFEAGATHTGLASAKELVRAAAKSGADAIKFQTIFVDRLMSSQPVAVTYTTTTKSVQEDLATILRRRQLTDPEWLELARYAREQGITFFSTPDSPRSVDLLIEAGTPCIKIAGGDMNCLPLIRYAAETRLPVLLDTRGTLGELERAVETCLQAGNEQIVIVYCPSGYPATVEGVRLRSIELLRRTFPFPIGFSDHSPGIHMNVAALALGAHMIEKTITLDRHQASIEHVMSIEPKELEDFIVCLREVERALSGDRWRMMPGEERDGLKKMRRSVTLTRDKAAGDIITADDITYKRPGFGIASEFAGLVVGRRLREARPADSILAWEDLAS
ncbi:MAG: N-acetylneuraminate synthase family protein [Candidatus Rokubacteria bacterium]|nr:N-acetylneuraminate synthase family protein [Candidatus Rokubacteria bacterium]